MNPAPQDPADDFSSLLAAYDEALAAGCPLPLPDEKGFAASDRPRLERDLAALRRLRHWGALERTEADPGSESSLLGGCSAELPWTRLGRFDLRRKLGSGTFGIVFLAYDPLLNREVALKIPRVEALFSSCWRERFDQEARAAAALDHPNLVPLFEAGAVGPLCYIVSAYCPGVSLARWLRERTEPIPFAEAAGLVATLAAAVQHAHSRGVVHRDLKPGNILLSGARGEGQGGREEQLSSLPLAPRPSSLIPKITDFGLAKFLVGGPATSPGEMPTRSGAIIGTASYMAPEQAAGKSRDIGPVADIYALGAILYELLTGRPPFPGESELDTLQRVQTEEPVSPARLRSRLPRDLETICLKCLQKQPSSRYPTAGALADDLGRFLAEEPIQARPIGAVERGGRWCRRNPTLAGTTLLALMALLATVGLSVGLAIERSLAADRLGHERQRTQEALNQSESHGRQLEALTGRLAQEKRSLEETDRQRRQSLGIAAGLARDRGLALCDQGNVFYGLLWLTRGLEIAPREEVALQRSIRTQLSAWSSWTGSLRRIIPQANHVYAAAVSPDGKLILTGHDDLKARLWEADTGRAVGSFLKHEAGVYAVAFSPDGRTLLTADGANKIQLWDTATGTVQGQAWTHPAWNHPLCVRAVAFSPDGQSFVTAGRDKMVRLWDTATRQPRGLALAHPENVWAVAISPDGQTIVSGAEDGSLRFWKTSTGQLLGTPLPQAGAVLALSFSPDGNTLLAVAGLQFLQRWDVSTRQPLGPPCRYPDNIRALHLTSESFTVLTEAKRADIALHLWQTAIGQVRQMPRKTRKAEGILAFSPDGQLYLTWGDRLAEIREAATGQRRGAVLSHAERVETAIFSPDGKRVLTGTVGGMGCLWESATGRPIGGPLPQGSHILSLAFSSDSQNVLIGTRHGTARLWSVARAEPLGEPLPHAGGQVRAVVFSLDGKQVVLAGLGVPAIRQWDVETRRELSVTLHQPDGVSLLAALPDGRTLLFAGPNKNAQLWDRSTGALGPLLRHEKKVAAATFSPDGKMVLTGSFDNSARLWDSTTGNPIGPPLPHTSAVLAGLFSPEGTILTGSLDGKIQRWKIPAPVEGTVEQIIVWSRVLSGLELDRAGVSHALGADAWQKYRQRLLELGGPPRQ